jgi:predicted amidohydrolase
VIVICLPFDASCAVRRGLEHAQPAPVLDPHHALVDEPGDRLRDGGARDAQLGRELVHRVQRARHEVAGDGQIPQPPVDLPVQAGRGRRQRLDLHHTSPPSDRQSRLGGELDTARRRLDGTSSTTPVRPSNTKSTEEKEKRNGELVRVALAQIDSSIGEVDANLDRMREVTAEANSQGADLTVFPELATHGYALGQILDHRSISARDQRLAELSSGRSDVLAGFHEDGGVRSYNAAAYLSQGAVVHVHRKLFLPTYLAWEERKHASSGQSLRAYDTPHARTATLICNDAWQPALPWLAAQDGAELLLVPTNSATGLGPITLDTIEYWQHLLVYIARMQQCWVVFVNRVGTEGGGRFWGGSRIVDPTGAVVAQAPLWEPALVTLDIDVTAARRRRREVPLLAEARLALIEREVHRLIDEGGDT